MKKVIYFIIVVFCFSVFYFVQAGAQQPTEEKEKTKLESFQLQTGSVVIKGYSEIGKITALGTIEVTAMEFIDATTMEKESGIVIEVTEAGRFENSKRSFIDYDEINSLLKGIDYIKKIDKKVTKHDMFEAIYRTKDYFEACIYNDNVKNELNIAVKCGYISSATAFISLQQIGELRELLVKAKDRLESVSKD